MGTTTGRGEGHEGLPPAEEVFAEHLARRDAGAAETFEALLAAHPALATDLRRLWEERERCSQDLGWVLAGPGEEARGALGERVSIGAAGRARYRILGEMARGGMGSILRVWDHELRRALAMKVVLAPEPGGTDEPQEVDSRLAARFVDEAQITGQLDHPAIVPVHELARDAEGRAYFTMRLVKGRHFGEIVEAVHAGRDGWTLTRALGVLLKVCEAVAYAHDKGVIHRDLKPQNVMVGRFGEVYVMDWGLARVLGQRDRRDLRLAEPSTLAVRTDRREATEDPDSPLRTLDGDVVGTPAYMPPEQARGEVEKLDRRSDVYSLGAMLYHLLAGQAPYSRPGARVSPRTVLQWVLDGPPRPVHEMGTQVPAELAAICERAMAREQDARYPGTLALAEDLSAFLEGRVVSAHRTGALAELDKWVQRNRALAVSAAAALAIALAGLGVVGWVESRGRARAEDQAQRAESERRRADSERLRAEAERQRAEAESERAALREGEALAERDRAEGALRDARWQSYVSSLRAAQASVAAEGFAEAQRLLAAAPEEHRGFEWDHLWLSADRSAAVLEGDGSPVHAIAYSPEGTRLAVGYGSGEIRLFDPDGVRIPITLEGHERALHGLAFSSAGLLASGSADGRVRVWEPGTGALRAELEPVLEEAQGATADPDDPLAWHRFRRPGPLEVHGVAFSPDGQRLAAGYWDGAVRLWDVETGSGVATFEGHKPPVAAVVFSPDGSRLASSGRIAPVRVWDVATGELQLELAVFASAPLAFSPDGGRLASGYHISVALWNPDSGDSEGVLQGSLRWVTAVGFDPSGARLVSGHADGTLRLWDLASGEILAILPGHLAAVTAVAFHPRGGILASGSRDGTVRLWHAEEGGAAAAQPGGFGGGVQTCCPDLERMVWAHGSGRFSVRDVRDQGRTKAIEVRRASGDRVSPLLLAGTRLVSAGDESLTVQDTETGEELLSLPRTPRAPLALSPDGRRLATVAGEDRLQVFDIDTGAVLASLPEGTGRMLLIVAFSPGGELLATLDTTLRVWDAVTGETLVTLEGAATVSSLAFSPDGRRIAMSDMSGRVWTWDVASGALLATLEGHSDRLERLAFSPDGARLATASHDGTVRLWDPRRPETLAVLALPAGIACMGFSPDGRHLAAVGPGGALQVWSRDLERARSFWGAERRTPARARGRTPR